MIGLVGCLMHCADERGLSVIKVFLVVGAARCKASEQKHAGNKCCGGVYGEGQTKGAHQNMQLLR
eukprot:2331510-Amphidinium_carterae.1